MPSAGHASELLMIRLLPGPRSRTSLPFTIYSLPPFLPRIIFLLNSGLRYAPSTLTCLRLLSCLIVRTRGTSWTEGAMILLVNSACAEHGQSFSCFLRPRRGHNRPILFPGSLALLPAESPVNTDVSWVSPIISSSQLLSKIILFFWHP